jgi:hypothetical protein
VASSLQPAELSAAQWSYLIAVLKAEAGLGSAPPGTSPGTRLTGVKYIGKAYHMWTDETPAIGLQLKRAKLLPCASRRKWLYTQFDIIMGVNSTIATAAPNKPNLEDAMAQLQPLVSDGQGNGLANVLLDPQYRTLGSSTVNSVVQQNAQTSLTDEVEYEWEVGQGQNAQIVAYALLTFTAKQIIAIA